MRGSESAPSHHVDSPITRDDSQTAALPTTIATQPIPNNSRHTELS